ncbi:MAG: LuxR C-terminal-related transcriptional regulator [Acidimicrobiaceae bacterium]|nr:LuxR C-terminal-related transcriptional regulator [Acidimicrobiaceae bacterium]
MGVELSEGAALARVRLACGRLVGGADAILEAYRFGVPDGPHREPWSAGYHREAVHVYNESLPWTYQRDVARLFRDSLHAMTRCSIPAPLAEDWAIVTAYLREAADAIEDWLVSNKPQPHPPRPTGGPALTADNPRVIHWDALAGLTTRHGTQRLKNASVAVQQHLDAEAPQSLQTAELQMLERLASGASIADVASEMGYSERSMYRELSKLWDKLGVSGRAAGVHKATAEGLID